MGFMRHTGLAAVVGSALALAAGPGVVRAAVATPSQNFVSQAYLDILNRPVDAGSLATLSTALDGSSFTRTQVALTLATSNEYRQIEVENGYGLLLHRTADPTGLSSGVSYLQQGGTIEGLQAILAGTTEYLAVHGGTNDGWLDGAYADLLGRPISTAERTADDLLLATETRPQLAGALMGSQEYRTDVVDAIFVHYLHRHADPNGLSSFVGEMNGGASDETVISQVVGSSEYFSNAQSVPEPASVSLMLGGILLVRRPRRRK